MCRGNEKLSGITINMSRGAGACVGTVAVAGKKITGVVAGGVKAVGRLLTRPVETPELIAEEQTESTSEGFGVGARDEQKKWAKSLISALESDIAAARGRLQEMQGKAEKTQSQIASQLSELQLEKESLLTELEEARSEANKATVQASEVKTRVTALESDLVAVQHHLEKSRKEEDTKPQPSSVLSPVQSRLVGTLPTPLEEVVVVAAEEESDSSIPIHRNTRLNEKASVRTEESRQVGVSEGQTPSLPAMIDKEVRAAVFDNETKRIIFRRALSDIANQDPAARADAVKTIAGIRHELSVRVLVNQMASEPSAQVRQECIKALTTLQMTEGLGAVEQALSDRAALVRLAAVWGLYRLAGAESVAALVRMFSDEDVEVRRRAVTCIGWLGREELAVKLLPLLDDSSVSVRLAVVEAMGNLRCRRGVTALIERLNDPEKAVRKAVLGALETITGKKMSGPFPREKRSLQRLIARWRGWWKEEQPG